jgi:signal peptidase I
MGVIPKVGDIIVYNPPYYKGIKRAYVISFAKSGLPIIGPSNNISHLVRADTPKTGFAIIR